MTYPKILLVDDDLDDQKFFIDALQEISPYLNCSVANNGIEALEHLALKPPSPSVIFLDLNMPLMNGLECLKNLKSNKLYNEIPVVILTTSNNSVYKLETARLGAESYLTKANSFETLKINLKEVLEKRFGNIPS